MSQLMNIRVNTVMISYQTEHYNDCIKEIDALLYAHWQEVALNHDDVPLDKDEASYQKLADDGQLNIVTVRNDGRLIGYHASIVKTHLHYKSTLHAFVDVYYLMPEYRRGGIGIQLIKEAELSLANRGVVKVFTGTKKHLDMSKLFLRLGWHETETVFSKILRRVPS